MNENIVMRVERRSNASRRRRRGQPPVRVERTRVVLLATGTLVLLAAPADAYIGPGAGFALVSSFLVFFTTLVIAGFYVVRWPLRLAWRLVHRRKRTVPSIRRLVIIGFDGQDPGLTDRWLEAGKLPNFARLAAAGCYHRLQTTFPAVSPVAWSSFATGTHPGRHNIFDFIDRDPRTYLPRLSSADLRPAKRFLRLGRFQVPLERPTLRLLRKSRAFWTTLGEHDIWSTVLRVPITFPPERFYGAQLSAMCVPDLRGTQGTFTVYSTRPSSAGSLDGGVRVHFEFYDEVARTVITGPENPFVVGQPPIEIPIHIVREPRDRRARVTIGGTTHVLEVGSLSDWIALEFRALPVLTIRGTCRMLVTEMDDHFSLYVTPINVDPEKPAMPISHPAYYATYLAQKIGRFATLGLAEDTGALNESVVDEAAFLRQTYDIQDERERMFTAALDKLHSGSLVCVFDATDRIQHMFWRYLDPKHRAPRDGPRHEDAIEALYRRNDTFLGRVLDRLEDDDVLMVISDHGFSSFRRGVNLNSWLRAHGFLALEREADGRSDWLRGVDWSRTRAYAMGLAGIYLNISGRERSGIVPPAEAAGLKQELIERLTGLVDPDTGDVAITHVADTTQRYAGPYVGHGPDLLVGYNALYRISWKGASGVVDGPVFEDNTKAWSGDHCIDPALVPGVFFCSRPITRRDPALVDIAPTALRLFGIDPPPYMEGRALFGDELDSPAAGKTAREARS